MEVFKRINGISDIERAVYVVYGDSDAPVVSSVIGIMGVEYRVFRGSDDAMKGLGDESPDIVFVGPAGEAEFEEQFAFCRDLRASGYQGIVVLITGLEMDSTGTAHITSEGFDNYILASDGQARIRDSIHWAILNRKRRNKYIIQFDDSPDSFFTVDRNGNIYDINRRATHGTDYRPKDVVKGCVNLAEIGALRYFWSTVQPLITKANIGRVFSRTIDEVGEVLQIKVSVHNMPTMGLVATVTETDITKTMYSHTMDILMNSVSMLSQRDNYTAEHSSRVFFYCTHIARELGCSKARKFLRDLYFAALLHDIGKVGVKDEVLLKPDRLTASEYAELSTHPARGCEILKPYRFLKDSIDFVRSHHERPDGKGYPDRLRASTISFGSSIIAVADGFDAMTSTRPYRKSLPFESALAEIRENLRVQFDEEAGKALLSVVSPGMVEQVRVAAQRPLQEISRELIETVIG